MGRSILLRRCTERNREIADGKLQIEDVEQMNKEQMNKIGNG